MTKYAIQLNNVSKIYKDGEYKNTVLDNISLKVKEGEFVAIVGPSGSGKSTMLSIAGALLSSTHGEVIIGDTLVDKKIWNKIRKEKIGFIFQYHQLIPYLTVEDQLKLIFKISNNKNKKEFQEYADELLNDLGLLEKKNKYPKSLSGGEKQRVAIARAFMNKPDIILADEPTASLDGVRGRQVVEMIRSQVKKQNRAAVMVTHDERVLDLVDSIYRIEGGKITLVKSNDKQ